MDLDRAVVGMASPIDVPLTLDSSPELRAEYFTERRELGALNIGGAGVVHVGEATGMTSRTWTFIYIGRGNPEIRFESKDKESPAVFYILSYPAHAAIR